MLNGCLALPQEEKCLRDHVVGKIVKIFAINQLTSKHSIVLADTIQWSACIYGFSVFLNGLLA